MNSQYTALIFCISLFFLWGSVFLFATGETNETNSYHKEIELSEETRRQDSTPLSEETSNTPLLMLEKCWYHQEGNTYTIKAICILQGKLPPLSTKEIVDLLRDDIDTFTERYQPFETDATYYGGQPVYKNPDTSLLNGSFETTQHLINLAKQEKEVWFTKTELARYRASTLSFYVSDKDISNLSKCNTQNYTLALQRIDNYLLKPGEHFNANRELAKVKNYCTGRGETKFLFYGGVCGMSAQVFRTTLIHPHIEITKRHPHNERFVQYYGTEVGGDDAAVYEMSKQFEIKNSWTADIYFKVQRRSGHNVLVAISPHTNQQVQLTKHPINALNIDLERTIWEKEEKADFPLQPNPLFSQPTETTTHLINQETFHSTYLKKNYELR